MRPQGRESEAKTAAGRGERSQSHSKRTEQENTVRTSSPAKTDLQDFYGEQLGVVTENGN
jgi:hypothetical protein